MSGYCWDLGHCNHKLETKSETPHMHLWDKVWFSTWIQRSCTGCLYFLFILAGSISSQCFNLLHTAIVGCRSLTAFHPNSELRERIVILNMHFQRHLLSSSLEDPSEGGVSNQTLKQWVHYSYHFLPWKQFLCFHPVQSFSHSEVIHNILSMCLQALWKVASFFISYWRPYLPWTILYHDQCGTGWQNTTCPSIQARQ